MKLAVAILVLLSHGGFWVGGHEQTIELRWSIDRPMPDAVVKWDLKVANTTLAADQLALPGRDGKATIRFDAPVVREHTEMQFSYRVLDAKTQAELTSGSARVQVYADRLKELETITKGTPVLVLDAPGNLPALLTSAGVKFDHSDDGLIAATQKLILIGENYPGLNGPAGETIQALARGGASVLVFRQTALPRLWNYDCAPRDVAGYAFAADHALLRHLPLEVWKTMLNDPPRQVALALPAKEPVLAVVHSPIESQDVNAAAVDALLVSRTIGSGRVVFCQLPVNEAASDARQQQLLINLIEYAQTRPQPTPPLVESKPAPKTQTREATLEIYGRER